MQSPFDLLKNQIESIEQTISNKVQDIQKLNAEVKGLQDALKDYERALELERYSGLQDMVNKAYEGLTE